MHLNMQRPQQRPPAHEQSDTSLAPVASDCAQSASLRPRLLVLTSTFPRWQGDSEPPFVFELCRRLAADFDVWVLAPNAPGAKRTESIDGIKIVRYRYCLASLERVAYEGGITAKLRRNRLNWLIVPFFLFGQWVATRRLLRRHHFDAIHAHWIIPQALTAVLATKAAARPPILCTSHGGDLFGLRGRLLERIKRAVLRKTTRNTVVSDAMKTEALRIAGNDLPVEVIPMGADLQHRFVPPIAPRQPRSLIFVGRLVEKKGLPYLLRALPPLLADFPELVLTVAGDGPERQHMEQLAQQLKLDRHVRFIGRTTNDALPTLYQSAEICVFPSVVASDGDQEGLPVVPLEALGCECALVATRIAATEGLLSDRTNAMLVPERDTTALTAAIRNLLEDAELRNRLGKQGRASVLDRFDWASISARYAHVIRAMQPR